MRPLNAANVMLVLRDGIANDIEGLCKAFDLPPFYADYQLKGILTELKTAGLILQSGPAGNERIEIAPGWAPVQATLGISLKQLGSRDGDAMTVKPFFGTPDTRSHPIDVFVLMSFDEKRRFIFDDHIVKVAAALQLAAKRADDFFSPDHVMADVWNAINAARVIVADCTGRNPNVFYEIGMAHTLGKPVVLITQQARDVPFDLQAVRYIKYTYTPPGMKEFEERLGMTLKGILGLR